MHLFQEPNDNNPDRSLKFYEHILNLIEIQQNYQIILVTRNINGSVDKEEYSQI